MQFKKRKLSKTLWCIGSTWIKQQVPGSNMVTRCFTIAFVYDRKGNVLSTATSKAGPGSCCAERNALWKLKTDNRELIMLIIRIRRRRCNATIGDSLPCEYCKRTMEMYNVKHVMVSSKNGCRWYTMENLPNNGYYTKNSSIIYL